MMPLIGMIGVLLSVIVGYKMLQGNLSIMFQPAEFVIIGGIALFALIISSGKKFTVIFKHAAGIFKSPKTNRENYLDLLLLLHHLFAKAQREGLISLESHLDTPENSDIFKKFPSIASQAKIIVCITDNLRILISGGTAQTLDSLIEIDIDTQHREALYPSAIISKIADSLPGFGIVAAVLGVTLAMTKIAESPVVLGHTIAAALVGTFLGVLLCYGFVGPIATYLEHQVHEEEVFFTVIKMSLVAFAEGTHPILAVEAGRRAIPTYGRPSFQEIENEIRKWKGKA
ncbi:MAG TPA: flagellar motor stator protein MotA [Candidatus Deferrimicrobium sp.]|nr:flagellar motor stator protein MotA [Candidatus Deferrimicrobium sp.]